MQFVREKSIEMNCLTEGLRSIIHDRLIEYLSANNRNLVKYRIYCLNFMVLNDCLKEACFEHDPQVVEQNVKKAINRGHNRAKANRHSLKKGKEKERKEKPLV